MRVHFIAIGGSAMHNLAIALRQKGYNVSGSDDEIFEPSKSRLDKYNLLPKVEGWQPQLINSDLDVIILGMHARTDNPELLRAQELGLKIYSYPEYLYEQTKNKKRVVIGGSHGKTTCTSMVMHVLKSLEVKFDYMVGAKIDGFETMVGLNNDTEIAIFEGDEYLSSPIDLRPKFHHYRPHIALLTGVAWDHINVFPTFDAYVNQFKIFADSLKKNASLVYFVEDEYLRNIATTLRDDIKNIPYQTPAYLIEENCTSLICYEDIFPLKVFGEHNLQNIEGARLVCNELGISNTNFYKSIASFNGSARRLETIAENDTSTVYYDFAHSPSKLKATTQAVKEQFDSRELIAVMELHTFSSLKKEFLVQYKNSMKAADKAFVYYSPKTIEHKKLIPITEAQVKDAFGGNVEVYTNSDLMFDNLKAMKWEHKNLLIMSSGNFSGKDIKTFGQQLLA
ncbi:MAG: Mur ligase family protein [Prolixibacteraceae bacterium]|jgi:UDP-N-acetylmuramate: L-alanyl-gamma-D-glutamyl-meso-diaminopimelate ligase|nr:Mur ligase family protein [Prolixibacteraceae bacterium]